MLLQKLLVVVGNFFLKTDQLNSRRADPENQFQRDGSGAVSAPIPAPDNSNSRLTSILTTMLPLQNSLLFRFQIGNLGRHGFQCGAERQWKAHQRTMYIESR